VRSIGKSKRSEDPPLGLPPQSGALFASWSRYACTLLPRAIVYSGPLAPSVSCQPNGDAALSAGVASSARGPSFGLSVGKPSAR
jgi:hypothetical protein